MRISTVVLTLVSITWLHGHPAMALNVTLNGGGTSKFTNYAAGSSGNSDIEHVYPETIPFTYTSSVFSLSGSAVTEYTLSNGGFEISFDQSRGTPFGSAGHSWGSIFFSVDDNVAYSASGSFTASDPDGRRVSLLANLYDHTADEYLFFSSQDSDSTPDESFILGQSGGDYQNYSAGSLSGLLIAGHEYSFDHDASISTGGLVLSTVPQLMGASRFSSSANLPPPRYSPLG
jgi:hypothetical protein